jgi:hypothetical protein
MYTWVLEVSALEVNPVRISGVHALEDAAVNLVASYQHLRLSGVLKLLVYAALSYY